MYKNYLTNSLLFIVLIGSSLIYASDINIQNNAISKEEIKYGTSVDVRLTATKYFTKSDITNSDSSLLNEFVLLADRIGAISCSNDNLNLITSTLNEIAPQFKFKVRYYNNQPWVLNEQAANKLPNVKDGNLRGGLVALTIEPKEGDIRVVFVKDNKPYAMNPAGTEEDSDLSDDENQTYLNIARRELNEELGLDIPGDGFTRIGYFEFNGKNTLLSNLEFKNYTQIFTCHLNPIKTAEWLKKININEISDETINTYKFSNNEIEWVYIVKPEALMTNNDLMLPINDGKTVRVGTHHAEIPALILKAKFNKDVFLGRNVNYMNGKIECNNIEAHFIKQK